MVQPRPAIIRLALAFIIFYTFYFRIRKGCYLLVIYNIFFLSSHPHILIDATCNWADMSFVTGAVKANTHFTMTVIKSNLVFSFNTLLLVIQNTYSRPAILL